MWTEIGVKNDSKVCDDIWEDCVCRRKKLFKQWLNKYICKIKSLVQNKHDALVTIEGTNNQDLFVFIYYVLIYVSFVSFKLSKENMILWFENQGTGYESFQPVRMIVWI